MCVITGEKGAKKKNRADSNFEVTKHKIFAEWQHLFCYCGESLRCDQGYSRMCTGTTRQSSLDQPRTRTYSFFKTKVTALMIVGIRLLDFL